MLPMKKLLVKEDIVHYSSTSHKDSLGLVDKKGQQAFKLVHHNFGMHLWIMLQQAVSLKSLHKEGLVHLAIRARIMQFTSLSICPMAKKCLMAFKKSIPIIPQATLKK